MQYRFFFLNKEEKHDPANKGWSFINSHRDRLVTPAAEPAYLVPGFNKGSDFIVYQGKSYMIFKTYTDLDNKQFIVLCEESEFGADN